MASEPTPNGWCHEHGPVVATDDYCCPMGDDFDDYVDLCRESCTGSGADRALALLAEVEGLRAELSRWQTAAHDAAATIQAAKDGADAFGDRVGCRQCGLRVCSKHRFQDAGVGRLLAEVETLREQRDHEAWMHAACLSAVTVEPFEQWHESVYPSLAMQACLEIRKERDRLKAGVEELRRQWKAATACDDPETALAELSRLDKDRILTARELATLRAQLAAQAEVIDAFKEGAAGIYRLTTEMLANRATLSEVRAAAERPAVDMRTGEWRRGARDINMAITVLDILNRGQPAQPTVPAIDRKETR